MCFFSSAGAALGSPGGDYISVVNQAVTIDSTTSSFGYQLLDDDLVETMTETFQLVLSPGAGSPANISAAGSIATIAITDNDGEKFCCCFCPRTKVYGYAISRYLFHFL